jgi:hypothetical protein
MMELATGLPKRISVITNKLTTKGTYCRHEEGASLDRMTDDADDDEEGMNSVRWKLDGTRSKQGVWRAIGASR